MNKLVILTVLILNVYCGKNEEEETDVSSENTTIETAKIESGLTISDPLYTLNIDLENTDTQNAVLVIAVELHNDSYFVSPNEKREFSGKFYMDFAMYNNLSFEGDLIENPLSVEEIDPHPFVDGTVNWIRTNTTYKQNLKIKTQEDFEVFGRIQFTIEPRCTFEEIPFRISSDKGVLKVTDAKC